MLELERVSWINFLSYGNYVTDLPLADLGQCLITGEVVESDRDFGDLEYLDKDDARGKSNGAGKSTITNAILWGLFGRTMHSHSPGDKVINHYTRGDCAVDVRFKNGDRIHRLRNSEGKTELTFIRAGNEENLAASTMSTSKLMQAKLNKEFGLDWDVFCGSVFFSQYAKPWMEMPDAQRKQALERILHVDRYSLYADVCKEKCSKVEEGRSSRRARLEGLTQTTKQLTDSVRALAEELENFEAKREARKREAREEAEEALSERDAIALPDLEKLAARWDVVAKVEAKLEADRKEIVALRRRGNNVQNEANAKASEAKDKRRKVSEWERKDGKMCLACERDVPHSHVTQKTAPILAEAATLEADRDKLQATADDLKTKADELESQSRTLEERLESKRPKMTMERAQGLHREWKALDKQYNRALSRAEAIAAEENPHDDAVEKMEARIAKLDAEANSLEKEISQFDVLWNHYNYIGKSYGDRRKVKAYAFGKRVPFINSRLTHYLDVFELDVKLEFTDSLSIKSDKWGYDFFSGGERKRADIALMLSIFDLHEQMYGRQCNVMVLDEVDTRMDSKGVDSLIQIIKSELATKVETVLVVSHKSTMHDVFPRQINVKRVNRFSYIEEFR